MNKFLIYGVLLALTACGGGGGGDGGAAVDDNGSASGGSNDGGNGATVSLSTVSGSLEVIQTSAYVYETESDRVTFRGGVSHVKSADCGADTGFTVRVSNAATGDSQRAADRVNCVVIFVLIKAGIWQTGHMLLNAGSNRITITVEGGESMTITVNRVIDTEPPVVRFASPANGSTDVSTNTRVRATFSDQMTQSTINTSTILLEDPTGALVPGTVSYDFFNERAEFRPSGSLITATTYMARITTGVVDNAGNPMAVDYTWTFTTENDLTPPVLLAQTPAIDATCVAPDSFVGARFDEPLLPASVTPSTFILEDDAGDAVAGSVDLDDLTATFTPDTELAPGATYTARLTAGMTDFGGNALAPESWSFTTEHAPEGTWTQIAIPANVAGRSEHTAVWTGTEMIIFGGTQGNVLAEDHGRYYPALDQWTSVSSVNAPHGRRGHSAVWTGTQMIVWGGRTAFGAGTFSSGGRYDPVTDTWTAMSTVGAPYARYDHSAVWTGTELIIWGGRQFFTGTESNDGARYNPVTDTWTPMSDINVPTVRWQHHAVWDGERMIVWGGQTVVNSALWWEQDGAMYHPATDVWSALPTQNAPDPTRSIFHEYSLAWTGSDMFVWLLRNDFVQDPWTGIYSNVPSPEARRFGGNDQWQTVVDSCQSEAVPNAIWLNGRFLSWSDDFAEGDSYDEQRDAWIPITPFPGDPVTGASFVATGDSIIVFGGDRGIANSGRTNAGYRLTP